MLPAKLTPWVMGPGNYQARITWQPCPWKPWWNESPLLKLKIRTKEVKETSSSSCRSVINLIFPLPGKNQGQACPGAGATFPSWCVWSRQDCRGPSGFTSWLLPEVWVGRAAGHWRNTESWSDGVGERNPGSDSGGFPNRGMSRQPELPERFDRSCVPAVNGCSAVVQPGDRWGTREMDQGGILRKLNRNEIQVGKIKQTLVMIEKEWTDILVLSRRGCVNLGKSLRLCASPSRLPFWLLSRPIVKLRGKYVQFAAKCT